MEPDVYMMIEDENCLSDLAEILHHGQITTLFQPMFDLADNGIYAYEALSRGPEGSPLHRPDALFAAARQCGRLGTLERLCQACAIRRFEDLQLPGRLTINIDPLALIDGGHAERHLSQLLAETGLAPERIILELTEHSRIDRCTELKQAVHDCRDMGFSIAMDDLSAGYSNLRLLSDLEPDFVKLDKYFVSKIDADAVAADFVRTIVSLAKRVHCKVIAEGIETKTQLQRIRRLGIEYAQGYLLGRPTAQPSASVPAVLPETAEPGIPATISGHSPPDEQVASLDIHATPACTPHTSAFEALSLFQADPLLRAVPVLEDGYAVGLLTRENILGAFALTFGHSLHRKSHVEKLMHTDPLIAQVSDTLSDISRRATARPHQLIYAPIIIFDGGRYIGTASIHDLLEKITRVQISYALDANPLTGLPGNRSIDREVNRRLQEGQDFFLCHLDLDHFKAFNDHFGYERGDEMIMLTAELLREGRAEVDYIAHIGGDDFVFITADGGWEPRLRAILDAFSARSRLMYDEQDRQAGCIQVEDRSGNIRSVPLASLSVGVLPCPANRFSSHLEAAESVFEVKCLAKKQPGNSIVIDRRGS